MSSYVRVTTKLKKNGMWTQREMKGKIMKDNLLQMQEKKINQLCVNKKLEETAKCKQVVWF